MHKIRKPNISVLPTCFMLVSFMAYSAAVNMDPTCSPKCQMTFTGLHGVFPRKYNSPNTQRINYAPIIYVDHPMHKQIYSVRSILYKEKYFPFIQ
jgi:hypothetical protein